MAPPFIAYYGAATNNHFLLEEAYDQVMKYREVLSSRNNGSGLWEHIIGPLTAVSLFSFDSKVRAPKHRIGSWSLVYWVTPSFFRYPSSEPPQEMPGQSLVWLEC